MLSPPRRAGALGIAAPEAMRVVIPPSEPDAADAQRRPANIRRANAVRYAEAMALDLDLDPMAFRERVAAAMEDAA